MTEKVLFSPASIPQSQFLLSTSWLTIYGGAAFAGKSFCALGSMLPILGHKGTRAVVIRKTTKMLSGGSGLFDAAIHLYSQFDPKMRIKTRDLTLVFSSGAELAFTYLDKPADRLNLQGKEFSRICVDEGQQLSGDNVFYALSRLRSTRVNYPLQAHITCNPDPASFLMPFVEHMLDENLVPIRQAEYAERYFVRQDGQLLFYDNKEEAHAIHGGGEESPVKSYKFIPGSIYDNPRGLELNKDYISTLKALPPVESRRLLDGAWVKESKSGFFKREWIEYVDAPSVTATKRVRAWDLAFREVSEVTPRVDATAGVLMSKDQNNAFTVEDVIVLRRRVHDVEKAIFETAAKDGTDTWISLPLDPGATAGAYCRNLARKLGEMGYKVRLVRPEKGKLQRFNPFASVAQAGFVKIVRAEWTDHYIDELETTEFSNKTFDDQADATSDAFYLLNQGFTLPALSLGSVDISVGKPQPKFDFNRIDSTPSFSIPTFNISG